MADAPITLFIPLGNDRSNAGLTVRAESINEVNAVLDDLSMPLDEGAESKLSSLLNGVREVKAAVDLIFPAPVQTAPRAQVTHPQAKATPADAPTCAHGSMQYKEGVSKQGKAYKGWFCPAPYGQTKCDAQWVK
jgi:hypothetical protein